MSFYTKLRSQSFLEYECFCQQAGYTDYQLYKASYKQFNESMTFLDYYKILGIDKKATQQDVKYA